MGWDGIGWDEATGSLPWPFQSQQHGITDWKVKGKGPVFLPTTPPTPSKHTHTPNRRLGFKERTKMSHTR